MMPLYSRKSIIAEDTLANILSSYPAGSYPNKLALATDVGVRGALFLSNGTNWSQYNGVADFVSTLIWGVFGGSGATYTQTGTLVTVTATSHGMSATDLNGASVHLTISTGSALTGTYTNLQIVDANTFTVVSSVSATTSGNLGSNTAETMNPNTYTYPSRLSVSDTLNSSSFMLVKPTANTKTKKYYFGGQNCSSSNQTSTAVWQQVGHGTLLMTSVSSGVCSSYIVSGFAKRTAASNLLQASLQLANATDWAFMLLQRVGITTNS